MRARRFTELFYARQGNNLHQLRRRSEHDVPARGLQLPFVDGAGECVDAGVLCPTDSVML